VRRTGPETPDRLQWGSLAPDFLLGRLAFFFCYFLKPPLIPPYIDLPRTYLLHLLCYFFLLCGAVYIS
jgi:hypothetical protein